jgi:hypothetical protein
MSIHIGLSCAAFATIWGLFVYLNDLLNDCDFSLAMDCGNVLGSLVGQLRRANVEGTLNHKPAPISSVGLV